MKILAVADEESKYLWEYYEPRALGVAAVTAPVPGSLPKRK